jgi:hypothetical protein
VCVSAAFLGSFLSFLLSRRSFHRGRLVAKKLEAEEGQKRVGGYSSSASSSVLPSVVPACWGCTQRSYRARSSLYRKLDERATALGVFSHSAHREIDQAQLGRLSGEMIEVWKATLARTMSECRWFRVASSRLLHGTALESDFEKRRRLQTAW